jgi:hypothetical protein
MGRDCLKDHDDDRINAVLATAVSNFHLILNRNFRNFREW